MIVLLIEDQENELERAKEVLRNFGFKTAVATNLYDALRLLKQLERRIMGIVTDLHFPQGYEPGRWNVIPPELNDPTKPCGFAIVAEATKRGIPVVVCSNIDHHFAEYAKITIQALEALHPIQKIPFIMDSKDWQSAAQALGKLLSER